MKVLLILGFAVALAGCGKTLTQIQKVAHDLVDVAGKAYEDGKENYQSAKDAIAGGEQK